MNICFANLLEIPWLIYEGNSNYEILTIITYYMDNINEISISVNCGVTLLQKLDKSIEIITKQYKYTLWPSMLYSFLYFSKKITLIEHIYLKSVELLGTQN